MNNDSSQEPIILDEHNVTDGTKDLEETNCETSTSVIAVQPQSEFPRPQVNKPEGKVLLLSAFYILALLQLPRRFMNQRGRICNRIIPYGSSTSFLTDCSRGQPYLYRQ